MKLIYPAVFEECEEGGYTVTFPDLPGCITEGDDLAEALFMAVDAASLWVLDELEEGKNAPKATDTGSIKTEKGQFVNLVMLDMDAYAEKYGNKAVKKTLTIPAWMNTFAEKNNISCSKVLQDALAEMIAS